MTSRPSSASSRRGALIVALLVLATIWPYRLGAWAAVHFLGADDPSTMRTLVAWLFELPWLLLVLFVAVRAIRKHNAYQKALAEYQAVRPVTSSSGGTVYHHGACTIDHRTAESAAKCRKG